MENYLACEYNICMALKDEVYRKPFAGENVMANKYLPEMNRLLNLVAAASVFGKLSGFCGEGNFLGSGNEWLLSTYLHRNGEILLHIYFQSSPHFPIDFHFHDLLTLNPFIVVVNTFTWDLAP